MAMHKLLNRIFGVAEEINGANRCPTYLYRWSILSWQGRKVYLHKFVGDDWTLDLHDHPKRFISIGLQGAYVEHLSEGGYRYAVRRVFRAPWIRSFAAEHKHRIETPFGNCWTLVIVGKPVRDWGFWHDGEFVHWREYVSSETADKMKACE
jgi:hypothetical protein